LALAGGGPLGAVYEIGTVMALSEALVGFDSNDLDVYVGVSAGGFIAAGLANGLSPDYLCRMFIDSDSAEIPFEPGMLLKPAFGEYTRRGAMVPALLFESLREYLRSPLRQGFLASFQRLSRAIPTGVFQQRGNRRVPAPAVFAARPEQRLPPDQEPFVPGGNRPRFRDIGRIRFKGS
jgi:predicted acylesterase/phospholipase RssA